jgi:hypothetical protein
MNRDRTSIIDLHLFEKRVEEEDQRILQEKEDEDKQVCG